MCGVWCVCVVCVCVCGVWCGVCVCVCVCQLIPVAARSKAQVCGSLLDGIAGSNLLGGMVMSFVIVIFFRAEISATGRSFVQMSPTECGESECDLETST